LGPNDIVEGGAVKPGATHPSTRDGAGLKRMREKIILSADRTRVNRKGLSCQWDWGAVK